MMMLVRLGEIDLLLMVWAALVLGSLQSRLLLSATAHSICGPWGCGPETAAIVTMHAGWLAIIGPPLVYFPLRWKWSNARIYRLSLGLVGAGFVGVMAIVAWQWLVWLPQASLWSRDYIWQLCGFALLTEVDIPLLQLMLLASVLWVTTTFRGRVKRTQIFKNRPETMLATLQPTEICVDDQLIWEPPKDA